MGLGYDIASYQHFINSTDQREFASGNFISRCSGINELVHGSAIVIGDNQVSRGVSIGPCRSSCCCSSRGRSTISIACNTGGQEVHLVSSCGERTCNCCQDTVTVSKVLDIDVVNGSCETCDGDTSVSAGEYEGICTVSRINCQTGQVIGSVCLHQTCSTGEVVQLRTCPC